MMNSVSFAGNQAGAYQVTAPKKTSNAKKGAMIGAGLGVANSVVSTALKKDIFKGTIEILTQSGISKNKAVASIGAGLALGLALSTVTGALIGGGIGKIVDHFKKPKADVLDTKLAKEEPKEAKLDTEA